ncbi:MAG: protein-arginine deiminase family protein [Gemmatimonadaceae bacterium]
MPAYLTHAMILLKTVDWLEELRFRIGKRRSDGLPVGALEDRLDNLAWTALGTLREGASTARGPIPGARIENGIGDGLNQYAFVGSLGPDIPAAGHILALNHAWPWRQLHNGGPRRAYVNAKSTAFVLKFLEVTERYERTPRVTALRPRDAIAYALGHLTHIAADVILHPAVYELSEDHDGLDPHKHQKLEVALDARVAHGYFQRADLHDGQSWTAYYPDTSDFGEPLERLMSDLSEAFKDTYGDITPNAAVCRPANRAQCLAPKFDASFLMDGYRNTTRWAIDAGYDHSPAGLQILWTLAILGSTLLSALWLGIGTKHVWTVLSLVSDLHKEDLAKLSRCTEGDWTKEGMASADVWRDIVEEALNWSGRASMPFEFILGGDLWMYPLTFGQAPDGIFGQGTEDPWKKKHGREFAAFAYPVKDLTLFTLGEILPKLTDEKLWKWIWFGADIGLELLDHFLIKRESRTDNLEGDRVGHAVFLPKLILAGTITMSNAATLGWKSTRTERSDARTHCDDDHNETPLPPNPDGTYRSSGVDGEDFVFPLIVGALTAGAFVFWPGNFTDYFLEHTAGVRWPSTKTESVDRYLPVKTTGTGRKFDRDTATKFNVRLFTAVTSDAGGDYYPEGAATPDQVNEQEESDRAARKAELELWPNQEYTLPELFDHAASFASLLCLGAIAYDGAEPPVRQHMTAIFQDWNLDFSFVTQWLELFEGTADAPKGILRAAERYVRDLKAGAATLDKDAVSILQTALGVTDVAGSLDADFVRTGVALSALDRTRARGARLTRPGAILLPNVDIEKVPAIAAPLPSRAGLLDAQVDDKINVEGNDKDELTRFLVRKPGTAGAPHELVLRLNAADAARVRIFEVTAGTPDTWPFRLGATSAGVVEEYALPAGDPADVEFAIEAKWLTGDPSFSPATGPGPVSPLPFAPGGVASGAPTVAERRPNEIWLEVLHKEGGSIVPGIRDTAVFTIASFLLIPNTQPAERVWIAYIPDSLTRLRVNFIPALIAPTDERAPGNHPTVADVHDALASDPALLPLLNVTTHPAATGSLAEFDGHRPFPLGDAADAKLLYIIDSANVANETDTITDLGGVPAVKRRLRQTLPDQWVQDAFELGYTFAPHARMHVAFQNPRTTLADGLGKFVDRELPAENMGLFASLPTKTDATDFGGNIECSLPVSVTTALIADGAAGPEIPEHRPATHGKIILGEGTPHVFDIAESFAAPLSAGTVTAPLVAEFKAHNLFLDAAASVKTLTPDRRWRLTTATAGKYELRRTAGHIAVHFYRGVMDEYRTFLVQQRVQPIVNIDTSWLDVGHVDEVMVIVPDADPGRRFRLVVANSQLAVDILKEAQTLHESGPAAHPLTKMFRRRRWDGAPAPESIAQSTNAAQTVKKVRDRGRVFNEKIQTLRLRPIRDRLAAALGIAVADVIEVPVIYDSLPDALMSHLGAHHWKPSAPPAGAEKFTTMRTAAYVPNQANMQVVNDHILIPRPFGPRMKPGDVVTVLSNAGVSGVALGDLTGLDEHDSWERRGTTLASIATDYGVGAAAIKAHPANAGKFTGADTVKNNWDRIRIPEGRVDLFEACTRARLKATGAKLHFIDTWDWYHRQSGDIHCGTNVKRTPMENDPAFPKWWDAEAMRG